MSKKNTFLLLLLVSILAIAKFPHSAVALSALTDLWGQAGKNIYSLNYGNVGVGTSSPSQKLEVYSNNATGPVLKITGTSSDINGGPGLQFKNDGGSDAWLFLDSSSGTVSGGPNSLNLVNYYNAPLTLGTNSAINLLINGNGYVGIGTINPTRELEINGGLKLNPLSVSKPACDNSSRGVLWFTAGVGLTGPPAKDSFEVCARDVNGVSSWRLLF